MAPHLAADETAHQVRGRAAAAVHHAQQSAFHPLHRRIRVRWRQADLARQQVRVVARQQHHLAGVHDHRRRTLDFDHHLAVDHVVERDHAGRQVVLVAEVLGAHARGHAPRRGERGVEEDAAGDAQRLQHVGQGIHRHLPRSGPSRGTGGGSAKDGGGAAMGGARSGA
jgi:hypothetical protein